MTRLRALLLPALLLAALPAGASTLTVGSGWSDRCSDDLKVLSERLLPPEELAPISAVHLSLLAANLKARRGLRFEDPFWTDFFKDCPWYKPKVSPKDWDVQLSSITEVERKNLAAIEELRARKEAEVEQSASTTTLIPIHIDPSSAPAHSEVVFKCDLDGDKRAETIVLHHEEDSRVIVSAGGKLASAWGDWVSVVDLDAKDRLRELAVFDRGSGDEFVTAFFRYSGGRWVPMGEVDGDVLGILSFDEEAQRSDIPGDGTVTGRTRGTVLHAWTHPQTWKVQEDQRLAPVREDYYEMGTQVTLRRDLSLRSAPSEEAGTLFRLHAGDKAEIVKSDDKRWCMLRDMRGWEGWFEVVTDGFDVDVAGEPVAAGEVFGGLSQQAVLPEAVEAPGGHEDVIEQGDPQ